MALSTTFRQCAPETTKSGNITQNKGHFAVQGHSRSPIVVPVESTNSDIAFLCHPLGDLGVTYTVHLWLVGKRVVDFL